MMSMKGDGKPVSFIEDCAVDLDDLADYTERLNDVFARHGTKGTWYAHASVGCLHVRPVLNMKDPADVATMRAVAEECFCARARIQRLAQRRARRRHRPQRVQRGDVRRAHRSCVRNGEGRVRSGRHAEPRAASCARRGWTTARCSATAPAMRRSPTSRRNSTGPTIPARSAACSARSRCATTTAPAALSMPA